MTDDYTWVERKRDGRTNGWTDGLTWMGGNHDGRINMVGGRGELRFSMGECFFLSALKIKNHFTSFDTQNVLQKGF